MTIERACERGGAARKGVRTGGPRGVLVALALMAIAGCQNYGDQLRRANGYYEEHKYEHALAVLRNLEADRDSLDPLEEARYCYVRGMTDYRLGYGDDARYWLSLARAANEHAEGSLVPEEKNRMTEALAELNAPVYGLGQGKAFGQLGDPCKWTSECEAGFICEDGGCIQAE